MRKLLPLFLLLLCSPLSGGMNSGVSNSRVLSTPLTGFVSSPGTVSSTDSVLSAFGKLTGNNSLDITTLNGLTPASQLFSTGSSGSDFSISSGGSIHTFNLPSASGSNRGALLAADWTTFNNKLTSLNGLTNTSQSFIVGTSGTDFAISSVGGSHTFNLPTATFNNRGALSSADWNAFNGKQAAGNYITALTSDVTASGPGSVAATVASVGGSTAALVHAAELLANGATTVNTNGAIVKRDATGGSIFLATVNSTSELLNGATVVSNAVLTINNGHLRVTQTTAPLATVNAGVGVGAGSGATCTIAAGGTDNAFVMTINDGALEATGVWCTATFNKVFGSTPICSMTPGNQATAKGGFGAGTNIGMYITTTTSSVSVSASATDANASEALVWNFICIEPK